MKTLCTVLVVALAGSCVAADATNTIVTARLMSHRMTGAGSIEPGGGFYSYQTDFVVTSPANFGGIVLTLHSLGSGPNETNSNAVVAVQVPTASLQQAKTDGKPCRIEPKQMKSKTESNKEPEATR